MTCHTGDGPSSRGGARAVGFGTAPGGGSSRPQFFFGILSLSPFAHSTRVQVSPPARAPGAACSRGLLVRSMAKRGVRVWRGWGSGAEGRRLAGIMVWVQAEGRARRGAVPNRRGWRDGRRRRGAGMVKGGEGVRRGGDGAAAPTARPAASRPRGVGRGGCGKGLTGFLGGISGWGLGGAGAARGAHIGRTCKAATTRRTRHAGLAAGGLRPLGASLPRHV